MRRPDSPGAAGTTRAAPREGAPGTDAGPGDAPPRTEAPGDLPQDLLAWFDGRERDVPWRDESDPYRIWVAEVMAQQTRIETVRPYYGAFLSRFPDLESLAGAELDDVLKVWEGLGYYARARHLHRAARLVVAERGGRLPDTAEGLRELPGIGPYTAGAIASLAFGRAEPAVDGNVRRVLSRLFDLEGPSAGSLKAAARTLIDAAPGRAGALNQALMDLGSEVCTPRDPACGACPVEGRCLARRNGTIDRRPGRRARSRTPHRHWIAAAIRRDDRVLLVRRPEDGLLGGLWDLPAWTGDSGEPGPGPGSRNGSGEDRSRATESITRLAGDLGLALDPGERLATVEHAFSHFRLTLEVFEARWRSGRPAWADGWTWAASEELGEYPLPAYLRSVFPHLLGGRVPPPPTILP